MIQKIIHRWDMAPKEAESLQDDLRKKLIRCPLPENIRLVCALDASYSKTSNLIFGAAVVVDIETNCISEKLWGAEKIKFPYIPGLLTFREGPILCKVLSEIKSDVDILLFDGQGIAHPRHMGIAAHMGVLFDMPSVGCAKSRLCGNYIEPKTRKGCSRSITLDGDIVGRILRTQEGIKPIFVSPGHKADITSSVMLVKRLTTKFRLPDPVRFAHSFSNKIRIEHCGSTF